MVEQRRAGSSACEHLDLARPRRLRALRGRADRPRPWLPKRASRRAAPPASAQAARRARVRRPRRKRQASRHRSRPSRRAGRARSAGRNAIPPWEIGGRQVHGDPLGRQREADRGDRGAHPLAALPHRLVGEPDDEEVRHAGRQAAPAPRPRAPRARDTPPSIHARPCCPQLSFAACSMREASEVSTLFVRRIRARRRLRTPVGQDGGAGRSPDACGRSFTPPTSDERDHRLSLVAPHRPPRSDRARLAADRRDAVRRGDARSRAASSCSPAGLALILQELGAGRSGRYAAAAAKRWPRFARWRERGAEAQKPAPSRRDRGAQDGARHAQPRMAGEAGGAAARPRRMIDLSSFAGLSRASVSAAFAGGLFRVSDKRS